MFGVRSEWCKLLIVNSAQSLQRTLSESNAGSQLQSTPSHHNQLLESDDEDGEEIEIVDETQSEILNETGRDSSLGHEIHPDINLDTSGHSIDQSTGNSASSTEDSLQAAGIQSNLSLQGMFLRS